MRLLLLFKVNDKKVKLILQSVKQDCYDKNQDNKQRTPHRSQKRKDVLK